MKRQTPIVVGVVLVVLLAGTAALTGATTADGERRAGTSADFSVRQDSGNATNQVNVTVETVELRNVTVRNVVVDHVHVTGNVTAGDEASLETGNDTETVENVTAQQLRIGSATLENVSFSNLTVRNESLATALLGNQTPEDGELTVSSATLENRTIEGVAIEHGNLGDATVEEMQRQSVDAATTESDGATQEAAAMEIYSLSVDNATVEDASAVGLSIGNETAADGTSEGGDEP